MLHIYHGYGVIANTYLGPAIRKKRVFCFWYMQIVKAKGYAVYLESEFNSDLIP